MTKDEALKMAIKALAKCKEAYLAGPNWQKVGYDILDKSQQTCKEALEQPSMTYEQGFAHGYEAHKVEQEPLNLNCKSVQKRLAMQWGYVEQPAQNIRESFNEMLEDKVGYYKGKQPAQEPVAWMKSALDNARDVCKYLDHDMIKEAKAHTEFFWNDIDKIRDFDDIHLAPSWQGLSDDDITKAVLEIPATFPSIFGIARAIEAKLKEKNHG